MPLLTSPIDGSPMKQIERYGIKLDLCPTSGGIWFDKGEVEKLIHFVREETVKEMNESSNYRSEQPQHYQRSDHQAQYDHKRRPKKKSPLSDIMDIFDF